MNTDSITYPAIIQQGGLFKVRRPQGKRSGGGKRGTVSQENISPQSRKRLVEKTLTIDWDSLQDTHKGRFITLTLPQEYWHQGRFVRKALERLYRKMKRRGMDASIVRKEHGKKNRMMHFHLLTFVKRDVRGWEPELPEDEIPGWITQAWSGALGYEGRVRVQVEVPENWHQLQKYVTKYCMKIAYNDVEKKASAPAVGNSTAASAGASLSMSHNRPETIEAEHNISNGNRFWYIWGRDNLPWAELQILELSGRMLAETWKLRRIFRKIQAVRVKRAAMRRSFVALKGKSCIDIPKADSPDIESVFFRVFGSSGMGHIMKTLRHNSTYRSLCRGGFLGWSLWMDARDKDILFRSLTMEMCI